MGLLSRTARALGIGSVRAFDAGKASRRLRGVPTAQAAINSQMRSYGRTVIARSRYLAANNPYAAAAKDVFQSALVGSGIKPSSLIADADLKAGIQQAWLDWTDEADADGLTDFYGLQAIIAAEMFEAGECFVRFRPRRPEDGLSVPLQLQVLPSEMLPFSDNQDSFDGGQRVDMGIVFDPIGRRVAYRFLREHPDGNRATGEITTVPAEQVLHLYRPIRAGQIRGVPHSLSAIAKLAMLDQYDDAELERKRLAALFGAFVTRPAIEATEEDDDHPLGGAASAEVDNGFALEPGATVELEPGEDIRFAEPADVGGNYEVFQYRTLLAIAAGFGVPYANMTGDLRQTSYGSIRAGLIEFRRRVEAIQHHVMVYQLCRPVWNRWLTEAALAGALPLSPAEFLRQRQALRRVKWIPPRWDWIDPLKDRQAEKLAVDNGFKARSDVVEAEGYDPEEVDARIQADQERAERLGLTFGAEPQPPTQNVSIQED